MKAANNLSRINGTTFNEEEKQKASLSLSLSTPGGHIRRAEVSVNQSHYRPEVPREFQEVRVPRLGDNGPG